MSDFLSYLWRRTVCFFIGHRWYIVDYFYGMEGYGHTWNIKECDRCRKAELD